MDFKNIFNVILAIEETTWSLELICNYVIHMYFSPKDAKRRNNVENG